MSFRKRADGVMACEWCKGESNHAENFDCRPGSDRKKDFNMPNLSELISQLAEANEENAVLKSRVCDLVADLKNAALVLGHVGCSREDLGDALKAYVDAVEPLIGTVSGYSWEPVVRAHHLALAALAKKGAGI